MRLLPELKLITHHQNLHELRQRALWLGTVNRPVVGTAEILLGIREPAPLSPVPIPNSTPL